MKTYLFGSRFIFCLLLFILEAPSYSQSNSDYFYDAKNASNLLATLSGGASWGMTGNKQTFYLQPALLKTYRSTSSVNVYGVGDLFLGAEHRLSSQLMGQLGLDLGVTNTVIGRAMGMTHNVSNVGEIWEQANPDFDNYTYSYRVSQTRVAVKGKLLVEREYYQQIAPYVTVSLGAGFNNASGYGSTPRIEEESEQPPFGSHVSTSFTYTLGIGIEKAMNLHWSMGVGYEFSDLGSSSLNRAEGQTLNRGISLSHLYTNGIMVSLTYFR